MYTNLTLPVREYHLQQTLMGSGLLWAVTFFMPAGGLLIASTTCLEKWSNDSSWLLQTIHRGIICTSSQPQKKEWTGDRLQQKYSFLVLRSSFRHLKLIRVICCKCSVCLFWWTLNIYMVMNSSNSRLHHFQLQVCCKFWLKLFVFQNQMKMCFSFSDFITVLKGHCDFMIYFLRSWDLYVELANAEIRVKADILGSKMRGKIIHSPLWLLNGLLRHSQGKLAALFWF